MPFLRFRVFLPDGYFYRSHPEQTGWTHVVLSYIRPNDGEGIRIYYDGAEVTSDISKNGGPNKAGDGRTVVGRRYIDRDSGYVSVQFDELIYFNAALTDTDVHLIYNSVLLNSIETSCRKIRQS